MAKFLCHFLLLIICLVGSLNAMGLDLANGDEDDRTIILATGTGGINLTQLLPLLALAAAGIVPLLCLCALSLLLLWHLKDDKDSGYGGYQTSYSDYSRALGFDLDWEKLSIIDWIQMGEETFRKFDPMNLTCQTRLVCELHQNANQFGRFGGSIVQAFGYLKYLELFNLPEIVKGLVAEYVDAADKGRSLNKDCGDMYPECEFSVKNLYDRYIGVNEIQ